MKKSLDEELESVASAVAPEEEGVVKAVRQASPPKKRSTASLGILVVLLCMVAGIVTLVMLGFKEAAVYALPANELKARAGELTGRKVRVDGELVPGTLQKRDDPCEYRFTIQSKGTELTVHYPQCVVPDTFRDRPEGGVKVTVTGALEKDGHFQATEILAKCASKYDPKTHEITMPDGTRVKASPSTMPVDE
jgi:cytochrome c-type biogenesis protein CcmE